MGLPPVRRRRLANWAVPLGLIALMAVGYPYLADWVRAPLLRLFPPEGLTLAQTLSVIFGGPAVLFLIILSHEAGHALAGILGGLRFEMMAAGPVLLRSVEPGTGRRLKLGLNRQPALLAGYSVCLPPPEMIPQELRRAMVLHISGGPGASLIVGIGSLAAAVLMPATSGWESVARALLLLMGCGSLLVGLFTGLPTGGRSLLSDGARWLQLMRGGERASRDLTLLSTSSRSMAGDAPRLWDGHLLQAAGRIADSSLFEFWALRYLWLHHWDCSRIAEASAILQRALRVAEAHDHAVRRQAALDAARFSMWACSAPEVAAEWRGRARGTESLLTEDHEAAVASFFEAQASSDATP